MIIFTGILAINSLPISQFPEISPPMIIVRASYPGASAVVLTELVLIPLEQAINGVQGVKYMTSAATSAGEANIQIVFHLGTNPDQAVVNVNTRIAQVLNRLPILVQREGIIVNRVVPNMLMYVNLYSKDSKADMKFLFNFAGLI